MNHRSIYICIYCRVKFESCRILPGALVVPSEHSILWREKYILITVLSAKLLIFFSLLFLYYLFIFLSFFLTTLISAGPILTSVSYIASTTSGFVLNASPLGGSIKTACCLSLMGQNKTNFIVKLKYMRMVSIYGPHKVQTASDTYWHL